MTFKLLCKSWETVIKLFNHYSSIVFEVKHKAKYGERLPVTLPQVKFSKWNQANHIFFVSSKRIYKKSI